MNPISIHLPIELVLHIFVQSEQQDLLRLRGIARVFNPVLTRLAFRTIQTRCIAAGSVKRLCTLRDEHPLLGVHVEALRVIYDRESNPDLRSYIQDMLPSCSALPRLRTLELYLAFGSASTHCTLPDITNIAADTIKTWRWITEFRVLDAACLGLLVQITSTNITLALSSASSAAAHVRLPRWCFGSSRYTFVKLQRAVLGNDALRALCNALPYMRRFVLVDCIIDFGADATSTLHWWVLWERALAGASQLDVLEVSNCGYGRADGPGRTVVPVEQSFGLDLLLKRDMCALQRLEGQVAKRKGP